MNRDISEDLVKADAAEKRIKNAFLMLRRSESSRDKRLAQKILAEDISRAAVVRIEMFVGLFCSMLHAATTEQLHPGDQPLTLDDVAYLLVREVLWRLADEIDVEAAQATAEGALEVVEDNFKGRKAGKSRTIDNDY
ncbi:hypothetical protein [Methylobacterium sp. GC_Met_2]|uniref:hypothetical protein n=1 Tax=Methylobacterium sp. GC_Met_2 TaxID=2937376 RepID=UPI00226B3D2F|nr:hypothetical protein [Methylobacterium sp. GC_Met_2]